MAMSDKVKLLNSLIAARNRIDELIKKVGEELVNADPDISWDDDEPDIITPDKEYLPDEPIVMVNKQTAEELENAGLVKPKTNAPVLNAYGKWSHKHEKCIDCGRNDRPHKSGGRCTPCYGIWLKAKRNKPADEPAEPDAADDILGDIYECQNCAHRMAAVDGEMPNECDECGHAGFYKV